MKSIWCTVLFVFVFIVSVFIGNIDCYGQNYSKSHRSGKKIEKQYPSLFRNKKGSSHHKSYITIYATTAAEAHSGNPCAQRAANRMGFQYMLHYAHCEKNHSKVNNFFHNQTAYIGILFKNGPFWKRRFRKLAAECR